MCYEKSKKNEVLNMKKKCIIFVITMLALFIFALVLIYSVNSTKKENKIISTTNAELIYTETISPNEEYVTSEKDIVNYSVDIYQNKDNDIIVNADSTSGFFEKLQYVLEYDKTISKQDISIEWTTFMGNVEATKDNQLCIAKVSIINNEKILSERKINFVNKGIDIVIDMIEQNK